MKWFDCNNLIINVKCAYSLSFSSTSLPSDQISCKLKGNYFQYFSKVCDKSKKSCLMEHDIHFLRICRGVGGRLAMWAIANPVFGRIEGAARQWWRAALVLAHPVLGSQFRH